MAITLYGLITEIIFFYKKDSETEEKVKEK